MPINLVCCGGRGRRNGFGRRPNKVGVRAVVRPVRARGRGRRGGVFVRL